MEWYQVIAACAAYLVLGTTLGRVMFRWVLSDDPRREKCPQPLKDDCKFHDGEHLTTAATQAGWAATITLLLWPVVVVSLGVGSVVYGLVRLIGRETPGEREARLARERADAEKEAEKLAQENDLPSMTPTRQLVEVNRAERLIAATHSVSSADLPPSPDCTYHR